jgi:hypothetical protein
MLAVLVSRARDSNQIQGVVPHLIEDGLLILQYTDDTILFLEDDIAEAQNLKLILGVDGISLCTVGVCGPRHGGLAAPTRTAS